jgi:hypothetical protein
LPPSAQAVIHLAHDWRNTGATSADAGGLNAAGTRALVASSRSLGLGCFVFVSSQSARADAANIYGRAKWACERECGAPGEVAARVGLVYGGAWQAMFGLLCRLVRTVPVLPMIDPFRTVQPIHVEEVAEGLLRLATGPMNGVVGLAAPEGLRFGTFLTTLAQEFYGRQLHVLPIPLRLALFACDLSARLPGIPVVDRERVLGLAGTRAMDCADDLRALCLSVAPLAAGLRREPAARRAVLSEGRVFLRYVLGESPNYDVLRRYARSVASAGEGALALSGVFHVIPGLLRAIDPMSGHTPLRHRLRLAASIAESSPQGERVLATGGRSRRLASLAVQFALDALALPFRALARRH